MLFLFHFAWHQSKALRPSLSSWSGKCVSEEEEEKSTFISLCARIVYISERVNTREKKRILLLQRRRTPLFKVRRRNKKRTGQDTKQHSSLPHFFVYLTLKSQLEVPHLFDFA